HSPIQNPKSFKDSIKMPLDVASKLSLLTWDTADITVLSRFLEKSNRDSVDYESVPLHELKVISQLAKAEAPHIPASIRAAYNNSFFNKVLYAAGVCPRGSPLYLLQDR